MENIYVIILEESDAWGEEDVEMLREYFISYEQAKRFLLENGYKEKGTKPTEYYAKSGRNYYISATITKLSLYEVDK